MEKIPKKFVQPSYPNNNKNIATLQYFFVMSDVR